MSVRPNFKILNQLNTQNDENAMNSFDDQILPFAQCKCKTTSNSNSKHFIEFDTTAINLQKPYA